MIEVKETTDVAPLGIDEPNKVWRHGCHFTLPFELRCGSHCRSAVTVFLTEGEALKFREAFSRYTVAIYRDPYPMSLDNALIEAQVHGCDLVEVLSSTGRVIEEYPV